MEAMLFEVLTKCGLLLAGISAAAIWIHAGCPMWTITRRK